MKKIYRYLLLAGIVIPLALSGLHAQEYQMKKWVVASGGMLSEKNSNGVTMSGAAGQLAIEKISVKDSKDDIYQGFWVPDGILGTSVEIIDVKGPEIVNFPNPFSSRTTVKYNLQGAARVSLNIYDMTGNIVKVLYSGVQGAGDQELVWDAKNSSGIDVGSGSYLYELQVEPAQMSGPGFRNYTLRNIMVVVR